MDKKHFDYTSRMIAILKSKGTYLREDRVEWPSMGDERWCFQCLHWVKEYKTHGQMYCELGESDYCRSHGKPYYKSKKYQKKPFLSKKDMEID
jgi:hypothetical protein